MNIEDILGHPSLIIILLLLGVLIVYRAVYTYRTYRKITSQSTERPKGRALSTVPTLYQPGQVETEFSQKIRKMLLKDHPLKLSAEAMAEACIRYRYGFTYNTIGKEFIQQVHQALSNLPLVYLQLLYHREVYVELDVVAEVAAVTDIDKEYPRIHLNKLFVIDKQVFETANNHIFPYGLGGILLHEMGHWLDWYLTPGQRLSASPEFQQAFKEDVGTIPEEIYLTEEEMYALTQHYGGHLKVPTEIQEYMEISLFANQEEEAFCEIMVLFILGAARHPIAPYFSRSIPVVQSILESALKEHVQ